MMTESIFHPKRSSGAALIIALIMLAVILIIGMAGSRMTQTEEQMTGNFYDRDMAFQAAEYALRAAERNIGSTPIVNLPKKLNTYGDITSKNDCENQVCGVVPEDGWVTVTALNNDVSGISSLRSNLLPQYSIQYMDQVSAAGSDKEAARDAANYQYENTIEQSQRGYIYRITARSSDPASDDTTGRAYVVLQSYVKRQ